MNPLDTTADPLLLIQNLDADKVRQQIEEHETNLQQKLADEKQRYEQALQQIKDEFSGELNALRQLRGIINARDGLKGIKPKQKRSANWAPKIYALLAMRGPMKPKDIVKALNGTSSIYAALTKDPRFLKQDDGRWAIQYPKGRQSLEVTAENIIATLHRTGPLTLNSLADHLRAKPALVLQILRGDRRFAQDNAGMWTNEL